MILFYLANQFFPSREERRKIEILTLIQETSLIRESYLSCLNSENSNIENCRKIILNISNNNHPISILEDGYWIVLSRNNSAFIMFKLVRNSFNKYEWQCFSSPQKIKPRACSSFDHEYGYD